MRKKSILRSMILLPLTIYFCGFVFVKLFCFLDSIFKIRDITLSTKVCLLKAMVFAVVMYGCESVKVPQKCPTFYDPMDYTVHGILQAIILNW